MDYPIGSAHCIEYSWEGNRVTFEDWGLRVWGHRCRADSKICKTLEESESFWLVLPQNAWVIDDIPRKPTPAPSWDELFGPVK